MKTFYEWADIPILSTREVIHAAYRKLALRHHPDKGGDLEKFKEIQAAYERCIKEIEESEQESKEQSGHNSYRSKGFMLGERFDVLFQSMNAPPPDLNLPYYEWFNANNYFKSNIEIIFEHQDKKIINPIFILSALLKTYIESCSSIYSFWGAFHYNLENAKAILSLLSSAATMNSTITFLEGLPNIIEEPRFLNVFNSFFSAYPAYYHRLKDCAVKNALTIIQLEDLILKNVLIKEAKRYINHRHYSINKNELKLFQITGLMADATRFYADNYLLEGHSIDDYDESKRDEYLLRLPPKYTLGKLSFLVPHVDAELMIEIILPIALRELSKKTDKNIVLCANVYEILKHAVPLVNTATITSQILPLMKDHLDSHYDSFSMLPVIQAIAINHTQLLENDILPLLAKSASSIHASKSFQVLTALLPLISDDVFHSLFTPVVIAALQDSNSRNIGLFQLINALQAMPATPQRTADLAQYKIAIDIYFKSLLTDLVTQLNLQYKDKMTEWLDSEKGIGSSLEKLPAPLIAKKDVNAVEATLLEFQFMIGNLPASQFKNTVLPLLKYCCHSDSTRVRQAVYRNFYEIALLPEFYASTQLKVECYRFLMLRVAYEKIGDHYDRWAYEFGHRAIANFIPYLDQAERDKLFAEILPKANMVINTLMDSVNNAHLEKLAALSPKMNESQQVQLFSHIFSKFVEKSSLYHDNKVEKLFKSSLKFIDKKTLCQHYLPAVLQAMRFGSTNDIFDFMIEEIVPHLNYEQYINLTRVVLKGFEAERMDKPAKAHALMHFYQHGLSFYNNSNALNNIETLMPEVKQQPMMLIG